MRIGLIGPGNFAMRAVLPAIAMADGVDLTAVYGRREEAARDAVERYGGAHCKSVEELCARRDVDAVFVVTPPAAHPDILRTIIAAGKPVICDKPVTLSSRELEQIVALAGQRGLPNAVNHEFRYDPGVTLVADLVRGGAIGRVHTSTYSLIGTFANDPNFTSQRYWSFHHSASEGGGLLPQVASHHLDLHLYVFGGLEPSGGCLSKMIAERPTAPSTLGGPAGPMKPVEVEDCAALAARLPSGGAASLTFTNVATSMPDLRWLIHGDKGSIAYRGKGGWFGGDIELAEGWMSAPRMISVPQRRGGNESPGIDGWMKDLTAELVADFAAVLGGGQEKGRFATLADELAVWRMIESWRAGN